MNYTKLRTIDIAYIGICVAMMAICAWISIPGPVSFTLQTFAVFFTCAILGGKRGLLAVCAYILLGFIGLPVFAGFRGGPGVLFGMTGGYILGFVLSAIVMWLFENLFGQKEWSLVLSMIIGLVLCYAFGTLWFMRVYMQANGAITLMASLSMCVFPFVIPDLMKIALAMFLYKRLNQFIK